MNDLWSTSDSEAWGQARDRYTSVVAAQGLKRLPELDRWYRDELPGRIAERNPPFVTRDDLVKATEWKMGRGVWRARNLVLVRSNPPELVEATSRDAFARTPDPAAPIAALSKLAGVGPATASAILAAYRPDVYPFFDDLVARQIPGFGAVDFTAKEYRRYADALRQRARELGAGWTPALVERALWAHTGGKAATTGATVGG